MPNLKLMNTLEKPIVSKLLKAAGSLFLKHGIRRVSVEEICQEAGVSKMTFYRHFRNKDDIALMTLGKFFDERMEKIEAILGSRLPFEEKIRRIVDLKMEGLKGTSNEMVREVLTDRESVAGKFLGELQARQTRKVRELYVGFQKNGDIRKDIKVDLIMYLIENLWNAFSDKKLLENYSDKAQLLEELSQAVYYGILPVKGKRLGLKPGHK